MKDGDMTLRSPSLYQRTEGGVEIMKKKTTVLWTFTVNVHTNTMDRLRKRLFEFFRSRKTTRVFSESEN